MFTVQIESVRAPNTLLQQLIVKGLFDFCYRYSRELKHSPKQDRLNDQVQIAL